MTKIAVLAAGGRMGDRISANLRGAPYWPSHGEASEAGRDRLKTLNLGCTPAETVLSSKCGLATLLDPLGGRTTPVVGLGALRRA